MSARGKDGEILSVWGLEENEHLVANAHALGFVEKGKNPSQTEIINRSVCLPVPESIVNLS